MQKMNKKMAKKYVICMLGFLIMLFPVAFMWLRERNKVYRECYVEAGVVVHAQDFFKNSNDRGYFTVDSQIFNKSIPGEYDLKLKTGWFVQDCKLVIIDTIPPAATSKTVYMEVNQYCTADNFVTDIIDATTVNVSYVKEPDFKTGGKQQVEVRLTDAGGNITDVDSELFLSQVVEELDVEAGGDLPTLKDFVIEGENAEFISQIDSFDYTELGENIVTLRVDGIVYQTKMNIVDTIPPEVQVHDVIGYTLISRKPEEFVTYVDDVTEVDISYRSEPDFTMPGKQMVEISFVDEGTNEVIRTAELFLQEDTEAPVITGAENLEVIIGQSVSYKKNVTVTDNCLEGLVFIVDNSAVNLNQVGVYPVIYKATDYAGNTSSVTVNLTVKPKRYDISEVNAMADRILSKIISEEMTPMEKVRAIYKYVSTHVSYISHSEKGNQVKAAYEGLVDGKGDCYVYACTTKVLLTRAGIENMDIVKIPAKTNHYWNLVNLGDGWYHLDTTPRKDHPTIFMWTEAQMMDYSARHGYEWLPITDRVMRMEGTDVIKDGYEWWNYEELLKGKEGIHSTAGKYAILAKTLFSVAGQAGKSIERYSEDGSWSMDDTARTMIESSVAGLESMVSGLTFGIISAETFGVSVDDICKNLEDGTQNLGQQAADYIKEHEDMYDRWNKGSELDKAGLICEALFKKTFSI